MFDAVSVRPSVAISEECGLTKQQSNYHGLAVIPKFSQAVLWSCGHKSPMAVLRHRTSALARSLSLFKVTVILTSLPRHDVELQRICCVF